MSNTHALTKERDYWFDNAKAFLVITVVIGHLIQIIVNQAEFTGTYSWLRTVYLSIYTFHMPVFLIISGRFSKKRVDRNDWVTVINKMVIPYIMTQVLMALLYRMVGFGKPDFSLISPLFSLWYIITIAVYQLITPHLIKFKWLLPASFLVALICSFQKFAFFGGLQRVFTFYPFFLFGYYTSTHSFEYCKKWFFRCIAILAFIALPFVMYYFKDSLDVQLFAGKRVYSYFFDKFGVGRLEHLLALLLRYLVGVLFFFFVMALSPCKKNIFSRVGTDSIYVYILQAFLYVGICGLENHLDILHLNSDIVAAIIIIAMPLLSLFLVSPFVKKLTSWFIAPNIDITKLKTH
ncbi:MAG: acyltransferase family protein [Acutalibacteraceae bacterium]|nr:acyltransferase family protein [Acutalibacteraceae bacterium]